MDNKIKYMQDLIGNRFGRLLVISEVPKEERQKKHRREFVCRCDCGEVVTVQRDNLVNGGTRSCGCLQKEIAKRINSEHNKDVIGKRFGRLVVESEVPKSEWRMPTKREYFCRCDCGNIVREKANALRTGNTKSCGCLFSDYVNNQGEDLTGQVFGELTAIKQVESCVYESGQRATQWLFRCSCGRELIVKVVNVKNGSTKSCGHIGNSLAEYEINKWLIQNNITFDTQATFTDLINPKTNHKLRYDFKIYRNDGTFFIIEHHGIQHFEATSDNFGALQREHTDKIKKDYCEANGIKMYVTVYNEDYIEKLRQIIQKELGQNIAAFEETEKCG